jgi:hypothetical protein
MTQYEQRILLSALKIATEDYLEQRQLLKEQIDAKFPMLSQEYQQSKGALLVLTRICRRLGIDGADMVERMLEDE